MQQSSPRSNASPARFIAPARLSAPAWMALASLVTVGLFLLASRAVYGLGFPLDDSWIHQTYARNLAAHGQWAFLPGQPSAGSTAPLWSALLAVGYLLRVPYLVWAYLLGGAALFLLAWIGERLGQSYRPGRSFLPWFGLFLAGEWHLAWAAVSGMETLLAALIVLLALWRIGVAQGRGWLVIGLIIGLSVWVRPDGITLIGPAVFTLALTERRRQELARGLGWLLLGVLALFLPYLLFNLVVQGSLWPNTFYAKQAEYAELRQVSIVTRYARQLMLPLIGSGVILLPGFVAFTIHAWREKRWAVLAAVLWFLGYGLLYALRLPVTYQYGRYFMPAMPVYFIVGLAGTLLLLRRLSTAREGRAARMGWVLSRAWVLSLAGVWLAFLAVGANRYAQDVGMIETEMVATARWAAQNIPAGSLSAVHDIGAFGYFAGLPLIDLAGLVSPEVIPFLRDEDRLAEYLDEQQVDYLITFPGWYPRLVQGQVVEFSTGGKFSPAMGGENMTVYRWGAPPQSGGN